MMYLVEKRRVTTASHWSFGQGKLESAVVAVGRRPSCFVCQNMSVPGRLS